MALPGKFATVVSMSENRANCRNCGEALLGPYCSHCGQNEGRGDFSFGLFYFAAFEYQSYSSHFDGLTEDLVRECTPDRTDATSTSDRYLRFWAGAGYAM